MLFVSSSFVFVYFGCIIFFWYAEAVLGPPARVLPLARTSDDGVPLPLGLPGLLVNGSVRAELVDGQLESLVARNSSLFFLGGGGDKKSLLPLLRLPSAAGGSMQIVLGDQWTFVRRVEFQLGGDAANPGDNGNDFFLILFYFLIILFLI